MSENNTQAATTNTTSGKAKKRERTITERQQWHFAVVAKFVAAIVSAYRYADDHAFLCDRVIALCQQYHEIDLPYWEAKNGSVELSRDDLVRSALVNVAKYGISIIGANTDENRQLEG